MTFGLRTDGSLRVIVTMQVEDYLYGVVPYEMSDTFPLEALKAQAVTARTYVMQRTVQNADKDYDVSDTTDDQVFKGLDARFELRSRRWTRRAGWWGCITANTPNASIPLPTVGRRRWRRTCGAMAITAI